MYATGARGIKEQAVDRWKKNGSKLLGRYREKNRWYWKWGVTSGEKNVS